MAILFFLPERSRSYEAKRRKKKIQSEEKRTRKVFKQIENLFFFPVEIKNFQTAETQEQRETEVVATRSTRLLRGAEGLHGEVRHLPAHLRRRRRGHDGREHHGDRHRRRRHGMVLSLLLR